MLRGLLIRGLILLALALPAAAVWVGSARLSADEVRRQFVAAVEGKLNDVEVSVGSARLQLFGGVTVTDLRLTRKGDAEPFLTAEKAVIAHNKLSLHRGRMDIRKVEIDRPTVRLNRSAGVWDLAGIAKPDPDAGGGPPPTVVLTRATLLVTDADGQMPPLAVTDARVSVVPEEGTELEIDAQATVAPRRLDGGPPAFAVPVSARVRFDRASKRVRAHVELPRLDLGPDLLGAACDRLRPALAEYAERFSARAAVAVDADVAPGRPPIIRGRVDLSAGRFTDERLPWPVENLRGRVWVQGGRVRVESLEANCGPTTCAIQAESRDDSAPIPDDPRDFLRDLDSLSATLTNVPLSDELFAKLPPESARVRAMADPSGALDLSVRLSRAAGSWRREVDVRPRGLNICYEKFRYRVENLSGVVAHVATDREPNETRVELNGTAGGRPLSIAGTVSGPGPDPKINVRVSGRDVPIDDRLFEALHPRHARSMKKLHARGRGAFVADFRQELGANRCENTFTIDVHTGELRDDRFPYRATDVRGRVVVHVVACDHDRPPRPGEAVRAPADEDRVEIQRFEARHGPGRLWVTGSNVPLPGTRDRRMRLRIQGADCPVDDDMKAAFAAVKIPEAWDALRPEGSVTFGADFEVTDHLSADLPVNKPLHDDPNWEPPFDPAADVQLAVNLVGPSVTPDFFPLKLSNVAGALFWENGKLGLCRLGGSHGAGRWELDAGEMRFAPKGELYGDFGRVTVRPLTVDAGLLAALPGGLRRGVEALNPRGPMELHARRLVVHRPPDGPAGPGQPTVYWNGELRLHGASLDAGLEWEDVAGAVAAEGRYDGDRVGGVVGAAWLERLTLAGQPLVGVKLAYGVPAQEAGAAPVLQVTDFAGTLYGGAVGGQARVVLDDVPRYRVWASAAEVDLAALAKRLGVGAGSELTGRAQGRLLVENPPDPETGVPTLRGAGQLDVPSGRMLNLPVLMPLLKVLKLQAPDQTAFEEAHATFTLHGPRLRFSQLDLVGTALSLGGSGEMTSDGKDARFEFYTVWSQTLKRWLTTPRGVDLAGSLSENLFQIEVTRTNGGEPQYKPHMLPGVTDPVRALAERARQRRDGAARAASP